MDPSERLTDYFAVCGLPDQPELTPDALEVLAERDNDIVDVAVVYGDALSEARVAPMEHGTPRTPTLPSARRSPSRACFVASVVVLRGQLS